MNNASSEPVSRSAGPLPSAIQRARWISRVSDDLFRVPGTRRRFGLDPLFGLVPGLGDWIPLVVSLDLLVTAARLGAGGAVLTRMLGNILVDAVVGMVPLVGDLFDAGWKANRRNLALLEALISDAGKARRRSRWVVGLVLGVAGASVVAGLWVGWRVMRWLVGLF